MMLHKEQVQPPRKNSESTTKCCVLENKIINTETTSMVLKLYYLVNDYYILMTYMNAT